MGDWRQLLIDAESMHMRCLRVSGHTHDIWEGREDPDFGQPGARWPRPRSNAELEGLRGLEPLRRPFDLQRRLEDRIEQPADLEQTPVVQVAVGKFVEPQAATGYNPTDR